MQGNSRSAAPDTVELLTVLRVKGASTVAQLSGALSLQESEARKLAADATAFGLAEWTGASSSHLRETKRGRDSWEAARTELSPEARRILRKGLEAFVRLDWPCKALIARMQESMRYGDGPRWHDLVELARLERAAAEILKNVSAIGRRFTGYGDRLKVARLMLERGDRRFLAGAEVDSFHNVWFELHEDFLLTLNLPRGA